MTGNSCTEALLVVAGVALAGAVLGLAVAAAAIFAAISLGWPAALWILHLGMLGGAAIGCTACYFFDEPRRFRLLFSLAAAAIGALGSMLVVEGSGTLVLSLLPHDRATAEFAFETTFTILPFAVIGGAIGGGALGPLAEQTGMAWSRAMIDRFGHRRSN